MTTVTTVRKDEAGMVTETTETIDTTQQNSAKISRNAKGETAWEIKVYNDDPKQTQDLLTQYIKAVEGKLK